MKKRIALIMAAAMLAVLAGGCGSSAFVDKAQAKTADAVRNVSESAEAAQKDTSTMTEEELHMLDDSPLGKSHLKIALLTSPSGTDDLAVNRGLRQGLSEFMESDKTVTVKEFVEKTGDPAACLKKADELAAGYDVVVVSGEMFSGIGKVAKKNKDVRFIVFDAVPQDEKGTPQALDNVTSFTYRDEECGFLAGIAAALESKSGKVAAVTAKDNGNVAANGKLGFACGVGYANKNLGTAVSVPVSDNEMTAKQLIAEGCDVLYPASPACTKDVLRAAKAAAGVRVIGSFIDQFPYGGNKKVNVVITSIYRMQGADLIGELMTIAMENGMAENKLLGAEDFSINYYFDTDRAALSGKTDAELEKAYELLRKGKIVPASLTNGMSADQFTGLDVTDAK